MPVTYPILRSGLNLTVPRNIYACDVDNVHRDLIQHECYTVIGSYVNFEHNVRCYGILLNGTPNVLNFSESAIYEIFNLNTENAYSVAFDSVTFDNTLGNLYSHQIKVNIGKPKSPYNIEIGEIFTSMILHECVSVNDLFSWDIHFAVGEKFKVMDIRSTLSHGLSVGIRFFNEDSGLENDTVYMCSTDFTKVTGKIVKKNIKIPEFKSFLAQTDIDLEGHDSYKIFSTLKAAKAYLKGRCAKGIIKASEIKITNTNSGNFVYWTILLDYYAETGFKRQKDFDQAYVKFKQSA